MRKTILALLVAISVAAGGTMAPQADRASFPAGLSSDNEAAHRMSWGSANIPVARPFSPNNGFSYVGGGGGG